MNARSKRQTGCGIVRIDSIGEDGIKKINKIASTFSPGSLSLLLSMLIVIVNVT